MKKIVYFFDTYKPKVPTKYSSQYDKFMFRLISINFKNRLQEIDKLNKNRKGYEIKIYSLDETSDLLLSKYCAKYGLKFVNSVELVKKSKFSPKKSLDFTRQSIISNQNLKWLNYNGINLLDVNELDIWHGYSNKIVKYIDLIDYVLYKEYPNVVYSCSDNTVYDLISKKSKSTKIKVIRKCSFYLRCLKYMFDISLPLGLEIVRFPLKMKIAKQIKIINKKKDKKDKLIFFTEIDSENRIEVFLNLLLKLNKYFNLIVIGLNSVGGKELKNAGIKFKELSEYISPNIFKSYKDAIKNNKRKYSLFNKNYEKYEIKYKGIKISKYLSNMYKYLFKIKFPGTIFYNEIIRKILKTEKPSAVIVDYYSDCFHKTTTKTSSLMKIPSITLQHGAFGNIPYLVPIVSDYFFAYGENFKKTFLKNGASSKKIIITGMPRSDELLSKEYNNSKEFLNIDTNSKEKIVTFFTQPFDKSYNKKLFLTVFNALKQINNIKVIIRPHPAEKEGLHKKMAKKIGLKIKILKNCDLFNLIYASDVIILVNSSIVLDAIILNKPVISVNICRELFHNNFLFKDIVPNIHNTLELVKVINKILSSNIKKKSHKQDRYIKSNLYKLDGKTCDRIIHNINKIIKKNKKT
tara:strand:- start:119 stop:2017 length:1899 start_codon:yes stop_codon:yes gene_type:complete